MTDMVESLNAWLNPPEIRSEIEEMEYEMEEERKSLLKYCVDDPGTVE